MKQVITGSQKVIVGVIAGVLLTAAVLGGSVFQTEEGNVDIVYRNGKAVSYVEPGLNFKIPIIESREPMEIRVRKNQEIFPVMTSGTNSETGKTEVQTPSTLKVAVIWSAPKAEVLNIIRKYGSLEQFESRILDNKLLNAAKEETSKKSIEEIVTDRNSLKQNTLARFKELMTDFAVNVHDLEIVDFTPNQDYMKAVNDKLIAKQKAEEESYTLQQNALIEQRKENAANSKAKAINSVTTADAARIRDLGDAEAHAIQKVQEQLAKSDRYVDYVIAKQWNGVQPTTQVTGSDNGILLNMSTK